MTLTSREGYPVLRRARARTQRREQPADQQEPSNSQHALGHPVRSISGWSIIYSLPAAGRVVMVTTLDGVQTEVWATPSFASSASAAAS